MFGSSTYTSRGRFKRTKFVASTVDETLFGKRQTSREHDPAPEFEPPWVDNGKTKVKPPPRPLLFYCPTTCSPSRSSSRASISTPERKYKPPKFSPTVVDDTLFGDTKKDNVHDLQMERFVTSMPPKDIRSEDWESDSAKSSRINSRRNHQEYHSEHLTKQLPPWR